MTSLAPPRVDPGFVVRMEPGRDHVDLVVPEMHCAGCMGKIERAVRAIPGVIAARVNLTARKLGADYDPSRVDADAIIAVVERLGYQARPLDATALDGEAADSERELMRAMAVAGFAAANVMLLSVSVWSGAEAATRDLFHWISAAIAVPAVICAIRPFARSAFTALAAGRLNMDVPITLAVVLATSVSLFETVAGGRHAYFDAAVGLLFFLLVGRFLDLRMRGVARSAAARLTSLAARSAAVLREDGSLVHVPVAAIVPGDRILVAAGERLPVDGAVVDGASDIDRSMLTGEPAPERVVAGAQVFAGTINLTGPLSVEATRRSADTLLAEIARLMESAERGRGRFVRIAEKAARIYAPAVHLLSLATFLGWIGLGLGWHDAMMAAVAVLIITCPCALGLAVPAVQVVASGLLFGRGVLIKDGAALERLASVDTVVFDKTGTLTESRPGLADAGGATDREWSMALALAGRSRHPLARALAAAATEYGHAPARLFDVTEHPGSGMSGRHGATEVRLGRGEWAGVGDANGIADHRSELWLRIGESLPVRFSFEDSPRADAAQTVTRLREAGLDVIVMSGDRPDTVAALTGSLDVTVWHANCLPARKAELVSGLAALGGRVLMVGDGINDGPALASAQVSMSPASGTDIAHAAADIVFSGTRLAPVAMTIDVARAARRTIVQNLVLAIGYNLVAVPLAMAGTVTPLIAAIAMSGSSILVTANAIGLRWALPLEPGGRPA